MPQKLELLSLQDLLMFMKVDEYLVGDPSCIGRTGETRPASLRGTEAAGVGGRQQEDKGDDMSSSVDASGVLSLQRSSVQIPSYFLLVF